MKKVFSFLLLSLSFHASHSQDARSRWVDSVFNTLDRNKKVAQLFMIQVSSYVQGEEKADLTKLVKSYGLGGIYVTRGGPVSHAYLLNQLQKVSKIRLLAGVSAEWGLEQTLDSTMGFQKPMAASAWKNDSLTTVWGKAIARQMRTLGFHINFAPHADDEIFMGDYLRYFSNNPKVVGDRAVKFSNAMKAEGILAVAKHLPRTWASGNPLTDSTLILNINQIDTASFGPFLKLIRNGVPGIATSYLHFSILQEQGVIPAAISQVFISEVLKKKLNFHGLVFSDVDDFKKIAGKKRPGEAELIAFETGADILMNPGNISASIKKISREVRKNKLLQEQLDQSVKKILAAKYDAGLSHYEPVNTDNLVRKLHSPDSYLIKHRLAEAAVTVVRNRDSTLPIRILEDRSFVSLSIGKEHDNEFTHFLKKYAPFKSLSIKNPQDTITVEIDPNDVVVVAIYPYMAGLEKKLLSWLDRISTIHKTVLVHFGNPFSLSAYPNASALIAAYTDQDYMASVVPQVIFGALPATGVSPVDLNMLHSGESVETEKIDRFTYTVPEAAGLDSRKLEKIRSIMKEAIDMGATPGCHTLVARGGKVVFEQSEGWLTYENQLPVNDETIYDLASVTKVTATLQTVMFMHEHGLIDINKKVSFYLPELKDSNKKDFTIKEILTHQAGLWPFLPFWAQTMKDSVQLPEYYSTQQSSDYPYPVSANLFAARSMKDSLWQWIIKARVRDKPPRTPYDYRYSDMGFYILQHLAEKILHQPIQDFLEQNLYGPIGAYTTGYLPLERFPIGRIAPTERDTLFRRSLLAGYVHDQGAAMHGGIAGHAGLFSTANDLAKLGQLWLQEGRYGGIQYFKPETIALFTSKQFSDSRRGLGWDKPTQSDWSGPTTMYSSSGTFGHTGFTGTCIWVDPEFDLVFVFLSNRVQPDMNNNKLLSANIRPRIQQVIYEAIFDYCATGN